MDFECPLYHETEKLFIFLSIHCKNSLKTSSITIAYRSISKTYIQQFYIFNIYGYSLFSSFLLKHINYLMIISQYIHTNFKKTIVLSRIYFYSIITPNKYGKNDF